MTANLSREESTAVYLEEARPRKRVEQTVTA